MADTKYEDEPMGLLDLIDDDTYAPCRCDPVVVTPVPERPHLGACKCGRLWSTLDQRPLLT
jgi:hypothetical protein